MDDRIVKIVLLAVMTVMVILTVVFNYLSTSEAGRDTGMFENKNNSYLPWNQRGNIKDTGITPARFAFTVWAVIYVYQAVSIAYQWSLVFRCDAEGRWLCSVPGLLPTAVPICHSVGSLGNIAWTLLADRVDTTPVMVVPQTIAIFVIPFALAFAIAFSCYALASQWQRLSRSRELSRELWLTAALHINANGLYLGWVAVASFLNLDIAIINLSGWDIAASDALCVSHVMLLLAVYALLDVTLLYKYLCLLFTPYLTAAWALATSLGATYSGKSASTVMSVEMLIGIVAVLLLKIILLVVCKDYGADCCRVKPDESEDKKIELA